LAKYSDTVSVVNIELVFSFHIQNHPTLCLIDRSRSSLRSLDHVVLLIRNEGDFKYKIARTFTARRKILEPRMEYGRHLRVSRDSKVQAVEGIMAGNASAFHQLKIPYICHSEAALSPS